MRWSCFRALASNALVASGLCPSPLLQSLVAAALGSDRRVASGIPLSLTLSVSFLDLGDGASPQRQTKRRVPEQYGNLLAYRARLLQRPSFARAVNEARRFRHYFPLGAPDRD